MPLLCEFGNDRFIACCRLSEFDAYLCAEWQIDIDSRTELNETEVFVNVAFLSFVSVGDNTSCNGAGYLAYKDFPMSVGVDDDGGALVFKACLWESCLVEVAVLVFHFFHYAVNGKPVGVYVSQ